MSKFKVGDRVRVLRHRAPAGNDLSSISGLVGAVVELGDFDEDFKDRGFDVFLAYGTSWLVRSDDIELLPVAPQPAGPIRTITRRELVPGVYGALKIYPADDWSIDRKATPAELREAARIFNEIADVLEEGE